MDVWIPRGSIAVVPEDNASVDGFENDGPGQAQDGKKLSKTRVMNDINGFRLELILKPITFNFPFRWM